MELESVVAVEAPHLHLRVVVAVVMEVELVMEAPHLHLRVVVAVVMDMVLDGAVAVEGVS